MFADPELTLALPPAITAATGMDALTHNIESYLSPAYHPLCDGIALEGLRIGARALATAVNEPGNLQARADMMMSSMMGAIAFQKDLGSVHACAHALGAVCDMHHGLANALMIDTVLAWNFEAVPAKFDELAHAAGVSGGGAAFVPWLQALKRQHRHRRRPGAARRDAGAVAAAGAAGGQRLHRPDQPAAGHRGRLRAPVPAGDVSDALPTPLAADRRLGAHLLPGRPGARPGRRVDQDAALPGTVGRALGDARRRDAGDGAGGRRRQHRHSAARSTWHDYAEALDGLVLQGGNDLAPESYGETPLHPDWAGDRVRDRYEMELVAAPSSTPASRCSASAAASSC